MDPDAALDELLHLVDRTLADDGDRPPPQDLDRVAELIDGLDGWLTAGGFLPSRWRPACR
jgi:hypothetical protein